MMDNSRRALLIAATGGMALTTASSPSTAQSVKYLECLTSDLTLYVRVGGLDTNDGLTPTTAFATVQHAYDFAADNFHLSGFKLTIDLGVGEFVGLATGKAVSGVSHPADVTLFGKGATTVLRQASSYGCVLLGMGASGHAMIRVKDMRVLNPSGFGLMSFGGGCALHWENIYFDTCGEHHVHIGHNSWGMQTGPCLIYGGAKSHLCAITKGIIATHAEYLGFSNTVTFPHGFITASDGSVYPASMTYGAPEKCMGPKYTINNGGLISVGGFLPGSAPGANNGGWYT